MKKTVRKFKYAELVKPDISIPEELPVSEYSDKIEIARTVCRWVALTIEDGQEVDTEKVLSTKNGNCLGKSVLAVSLLRGLNFTEEEVFVTVMVCKEESPFEALHALVFLEEDTFFDLIGGFHEYHRLLEEVSSTQTVVLMFNDKSCLVPY